MLGLFRFRMLRFCCVRENISKVYPIKPSKTQFKEPSTYFLYRQCATRYKRMIKPMENFCLQFYNLLNYSNGIFLFYEIWYWNLEILQLHSSILRGNWDDKCILLIHSLYICIIMYLAYITYNYICSILCYDEYTVAYKMLNETIVFHRMESFKATFCYLYAF